MYHKNQTKITPPVPRKAVITKMPAIPEVEEQITPVVTKIGPYAIKKTGVQKLIVNPKWSLKRVEMGVQVNASHVRPECAPFLRNSFMDWTTWLQKSMPPNFRNKRDLTGLLGTGLGVLNTIDSEVLLNKLTTIGSDLVKLQPLQSSLLALGNNHWKLTKILPEWEDTEERDHEVIISTLGTASENISLALGCTQAQLWMQSVAAAVIREGGEGIFPAEIRKIVWDNASDMERELQSWWVLVNFTYNLVTSPKTAPKRTFGSITNDQGQNVFGLDITETPEGDKWPQLIVQQILDREQKDTYVMKIKVEDGGSPPRSSTAILQVTVTDVNDNHPVFKENNIEVSVPENAPMGTSVSQLHATDADLGSSAQIHFYFSNQISSLSKRLFAIDDITGLITIREPLDREESLVHKLTVLASDGSSTPSRATVTVNVTDINDSVPSIDTRYIISLVNGTVLLSEKAPFKTKIALITVLDKDTDQNGKVTCFTDHDVPFRLKPVLGNQFLLETAAFLDYEATQEYAIKIVASDSGKPPLNQSAMLLIKIKDENDNAPVFTQPIIGLSIPENNAPGTQLTSISATDADSRQNAEISYILSSDAPPIFNLDHRTGILTAVRKLDRENQDRYSFTVLAKDNGMPPLQTNAPVTVSVLDQNDNSPAFTHNEYNFYVPENLPMEQQGSYTFQVKAVDGGRLQHSSTAKVTISVVDVNDNRPIFVIPSSNYSYELVPTSASPGSVVTKVFAVDNDTGINTELRYSIIGGNSRGLFTIDQLTGNITLKEKTITNSSYVQELVHRNMETPVSQNIGDGEITPQTNDYVKIIIAIAAGTMTVILIKKNKQSSPKSLLLNFVTIEESKPDDPGHEHINGTLDIPVELEEQTMGKYNWATTPTTFKPDSPDLAKHCKSASPQPTFQIKPETPVPPKKHYVIQELPLDNTFVVGCDSLSKCSSSSSRPLLTVFLNAAVKEASRPQAPYPPDR
ncbi:hypothetical protein DUI87_01947 [Hirundo rustica rustica]|uniref:Cadherin domain-containing protein n=1 Tax=Hirundo rustica rustica TaxID=333673 RepID=A0A3M0LDQ5_HIRRU|nr:hypothetical protein DUI87_01947 [Hirundo rustica rustica]